MTAIKKVLKSLSQPIDGASLAAFRILFGLMMLGGTLRFLMKGWVHDLYVQPHFFFSYYGFSWVKPWPETGMYAHFILLAVLSLMIALGLFYRLSIVLFFLSFTYAELLDKTNYLNHYYFISCLSFLMIFLPLHRVASLDARIWPRLKSDLVPRWALSSLRFQMGLVYFFAGIAKLKPDWLFYAQPLKIWLKAKADFPLIGSLFHEPWAAYAMSWAGAVFDLTVPFFLLSSRFRLWAYAAVVGFHLMTWKLFYIGMFPWIMIVCTLVFFPPEWPRKWVSFFQGRFNHKGLASPPSRSLSGTKPSEPPPLAHGVLYGLILRNLPQFSWIQGPLKRGVAIVLSLFFLVQVLFPLRHFLYSGDVCWTEQGYRFSWNVMVMEKTGVVEFLVRDPSTGQRWTVKPREYLTPLQAKMMSTQPDMILEFAHFLSKEFEKKIGKPVEVHAEAFASLNGRAPQPLIDSRVDLSREKDGFSAKSWILSFQEVPPLY